MKSAKKYGSFESLKEDEPASAASKLRKEKHAALEKALKEIYLLKKPKASLLKD